MTLECHGEWLSLYLDGELAPNEADRAEAHLATCEHCRLDLQALQRLDALTMAALPDAPPDLAERILSGLPAAVLPVAATPSYMKAGVGSFLLLILSSLGFVALAMPVLTQVWKITRKLSTTFWTAGTWQSGMPATFGVVMACVLLLTLAVYLTRVLDRPDEATS